LKFKELSANPQRTPKPLRLSCANVHFAVKCYTCTGPDNCLLPGSTPNCGTATNRNAAQVLCLATTAATAACTTLAHTASASYVASVVLAPPLLLLRACKHQDEDNVKHQRCWHMPQNIQHTNLDSQQQLKPRTGKRVVAQQA
jgi:hypothetical protein